MLKSMTAYGRAESSKGEPGFVVEIKSGNNRYREIILRLPQSFQPFEEKIKALISSKIRRGRVEVNVQMKDDEVKGLNLELNRPLVKAYINILNELNKELGSKQPVDLSLFAYLKDTIIVKQDTPDLEGIWRGLKEVIDEALSSLETMRINEGRALERDFLKRLDLIGSYIKEIRERCEVKVLEFRDALLQKIHKLVEHIEITEDRLLQEVAFLAERSDITEELVRTESHLDQFRNYMNHNDVVGRRLDFLLQEINREVNTIGSKASDFFISQRAVEVKAELEKVREQIQNVE